MPILKLQNRKWKCRVQSNLSCLMWEIYVLILSSGEIGYFED